MDSFNYKYDKGHRVFTEDSAQKNWPPMTVLDRVLAGNKIMREDPKDVLSKKVIDELTGKPKRTPYEAGYRVRLEHSPDNWSEFAIPESAIKGAVSEAKGGAIRMQVGGLSKLAKLFKAPQAEAMRLAQQRAALSPAKGGLGLPADNTPAQRAKAMGFDTDVYHGSRQDFSKFKGDQPVFAAENPDVASKYGNAIYPLKLRGKSLEISDLGKDGTSGWFANNLAKELKIPKKELEDLKMPRGEFNDSFMDKLESLWIKKFGDTRFSDIGERAMVNKLPKHGIDRLKVNDMSDMGGTQTQHMIPAESDNIRSRFAAFDPFRKDAATAAAMGVAAPDLLAEEKAKGGGVRMQVGGLSTLAKLGTAGTKLTKAEIAGLRARGMGVPGIDFADPLKAPTMRMSEALGNVGAEGKTLNFTEADRSRVFAENKGGTGFSGLQNYSQPHKQARTVWGFGNQSTAEKKIAQNDPDNTIWTTYAGSPEQHKSNTVVVKDAVKTLQAANQAGSVHPEQIKLINQRIKQAKNDKGNPLFSDDFDITDPQAINAATTFERRTAISDALMGVGVKKPMISKEFKAANPNVKYSDASDISRILTRETDPVLANANTFDVGPHLFVMDNKIIHRADLNEAFPVQVTGDDLGMRFKPTPIRSAAPEFMQKKAYGPTDPVNAWAMSRGNPKQFVSEEYLTNLQKEGYKDGGSAELPPFHDFEQIINRKDGGTVNTFEQRLKSALDQHMAGGGEVHMEQGGSYPPKKDVPEMSPQKYLELLALQPKLGLQSEKQIKAFLEEQYKKEKEEGFGTPQARMDRAIKTVTPFIGAGADIGNFAANIPHYLTEGVSAVGNYAMSKVPSMSKPASVLDTEGKGDRVPKYPLQSLPEFDPFYGSAAMQRDAKNAGLMGDSESPVYDTAMAFLAPYGAAKAPRAIEGGLNAVTAAARRPFTPATLTTEAVSPDLAKFKNPAFQDYVTGQMIGEGSAVPMTTMGGRKTSQTRGQGVYLNEAKELEKNPMVGVNIPRAGNLSTNKALRADIATAGQELGQEAMAAHRFVPMATNQIKDASAMMIRGQGGRPLTSKEVMAMANELPDMIVTHSPANGGLMVAPFGMTKGQIPQEFLSAQAVARKVLGKDASVQFGKADPNKDLMYMMRQDYANEGGRGVSQGAQATRNQLKRMDKNFPLARQ
jgi:hypothetical protein